MKAGYKKIVDEINCAVRLEQKASLENMNKELKGKRRIK
jgi:hypothetical protein